MEQATIARLLADAAEASADLLTELRAERDRLAVRLTTAMKLLQAVACSERGRSGRLELSAELERAVLACTTRVPWVAYYERRAQP